MNFSKQGLSLFLMISFFHFATAQHSPAVDTTAIVAPKNIKFNYKQVILPSVLIGYGVLGLGSDYLKDLNLNIRNETIENAESKLTIDDFLVYVPAASVYALNIVGVKGKNNLKDRSIVLATSMAFVIATVIPLKKITKEQRPDGSDTASFPSGHTALAFAGAEFLYQEYKDVSIWYGVSGYLMATATGALRIYNNKHWLTDVAAGAGIGILSTKAAYWLEPYIKSKLFPNDGKHKTVSIIAPFYNGKEAGLGFVSRF